MYNKRIKIANFPINLFTIKSLHKLIKLSILKNDKITILHANAHLIDIAYNKEKWLIDYFNNKVDYVLCDGAGIQVGAKLTGQDVPLKIPFNTWIWEFAKFILKNNFTIFLLGADYTTINKAEHNLEKRVPGIKIVGTNHGYFNKEENSKDNNTIVSQINKLSPNILLVGFGMPSQEKWIKENFNRLNVNIVLSCGGAFDFIAGNKPVAPYIFRFLYQEWLFRLILEPKRLWKRYLIGNIKALYYMMKYN